MTWAAELAQEGRGGAGSGQLHGAPALPEPRVTAGAALSSFRLSGGETRGPWASPVCLKPAPIARLSGPGGSSGSAWDAASGMILRRADPLPVAWVPGDLVLEPGAAY